MEKSGGKLPTKQTTRHIPKHRQPFGAINSRGEIKIQDKTTGESKWVDLKKPVALDLDGDPTHKRF